MALKSRRNKPEVREIVQAGHPVLRSQADLVATSRIGTKELNDLIDDMVATMRDAPGVGLAAPQIGLPLQLVVIEDRAAEPEDLDERNRKSVPLTVLINPKIETFGAQDVEFFEGCLSVKGYFAVTPRHERARVTALNEKGDEIVLDWDGWPARILQHECDHLAGKLYVDHMDTHTFSRVEYLIDNDES